MEAVSSFHCSDGGEDEVLVMIEVRVQLGIELHPHPQPLGWCAHPDAVADVQEVP